MVDKNDESSDPSASEQSDQGETFMDSDEEVNCFRNMHITVL